VKSWPVVIAVILCTLSVIGFQYFENRRLEARLKETDERVRALAMPVRYKYKIECLDEKFQVDSIGSLEKQNLQWWAEAAERAMAESSQEGWELVAAFPYTNNAWLKPMGVGFSAGIFRVFVVYRRPVSD